MCVLGRRRRSDCGWVQCHLYLVLHSGPTLLHKAKQDLLELAQGLEHLDGHTHLGWVLEGVGEKLYAVCHTCYVGEAVSTQNHCKSCSISHFQSVSFSSSLSGGPRHSASLNHVQYSSLTCNSVRHLRYHAL